MSTWKYRNGHYDGFQTSEEILAAIEHLTGDGILSETSQAYALWNNGYSARHNGHDVLRAARDAKGNKRAAVGPATGDRAARHASRTYVAARCAVAGNTVEALNEKE